MVKNTTTSYDDDETTSTSTTSTTTTPAPTGASTTSAEDTQAGAQEAAQKAAGTNEFTEFAKSMQASTGDVVKVPVTPQEIAAQGTKLGLAGDHTTGGFHDPLATAGRFPYEPVQMTRVWAMDNDHTTANRSGNDPLKPDCSVEA